MELSTPPCGWRSVVTSLAREIATEFADAFRPPPRPLSETELARLLERVRQGVLPPDEAARAIARLD